MPYGASAYGASAYGGSANAVNQQLILHSENSEPNVIVEGRVNFSGPEDFYEVLTHQLTEEIPVLYKIYSSHGEGETPQLQTTVGGGGPTQSIIGAAPIIVVTAEVDGGVSANGFTVVGRPYTQ